MTQDEELIAEMEKQSDEDHVRYREIELKRWRANLEVINRLKACGLWDCSDDLIKNYLKYGLAVRVTPADFPRLRKQFDQLKDSGIYELENAEKQTIRIWLDTGLVDISDSWSVRLFYVKPLAEDAPCRVVYSEPKPTLVCNV